MQAEDTIRLRGFQCAFLLSSPLVPQSTANLTLVLATGQYQPLILLPCARCIFNLPSKLRSYKMRQYWACRDVVVWGGKIADFFPVHGRTEEVGYNGCYTVGLISLFFSLSLLAGNRSLYADLDRQKNYCGIGLECCGGVDLGIQIRYYGY